jgi:hypothetical protein
MFPTKGRKMLRTSVVFYKLRASIIIYISRTFFQDRDEQVRLEKLQREEEDRLYRQFLEQREREHAKINNGVQEEWEVELEKLTTKFERELGR